MDARETIRDYYDALRRGESLETYFLEGDATVKFGVREAAYGYDAVAEALREQTRTTAEWTVESDALVVDERDGYATFADEVSLEWTDTDAGERRSFETRWSGTLEARENGGWAFVSMHVSVPETW